MLSTSCLPARRRRSRGYAAVLLGCALAAATSCSGRPGGSPPAGISLAAITRPPQAATSVLTGSPGVVAAAAARQLFASTPVVVIANGANSADLTAAAVRADRVHAPVLLLSARSAGRRPGGQAGSAAPRTGSPAWPGPAVAELRGTMRALGARAVLDVGVPRTLLAADLPGARVFGSVSSLPARKAPAPLAGVVMLVHRAESSSGTLAAAATARAAGASVIAVSGFDPRADPAAITALAAARPRHVLAVGSKFGSAGLLASRVAVAVTGVQLPGGGQVLFPAHRLLALYGYPGSPALGALGEQSLPASIQRIHAIAAQYRPLSRVPVIPAFEIIATVAQSSPGRDGTYSYDSPLSLLRPWVARASAAGMYVVLDLQPGRASLLAQARRYRSLLERPNVGLALDPEWKLQPGQLPLHQIGSVSITEVNRVVRWLAALTSRYHLPQKLLVLHQFRLSMIGDEQALDTSQDDLAIVIHMDGQGTPGDKLQTWQAVVASAPARVYFGWKNFLVKDHPTFTPGQTMANRPLPVMISYQ